VEPRYKTIGWWALKIIVAALFIAAASAKLAGVQQMVDEFNQIGLGQWFRFSPA
jgi:putative oxidoreductase